MKKTIHNAVSVLYEPQRGKRRKCWFVRWWGSPDENGKQKRYGRSFRQQRDAKALCAEKQAELNRGAGRDPVNVTLGDLTDEFKQARLSGLSHATRESYENTLTQAATYFGRQRLIRDIQQRHAEAFLATRKRCDGRAGELSSWAWARHLINMRALFNAAVAWGYLQENPFRTSKGTGGSALRQNPKSRPWHHLTPQEFVRLLAVMSSARQRAACWLLYGCGLRAGEVYNLMVSNIDLEKKRVNVVNRAATDDLPPFTVKAERQTAGSKERCVPIPDAALSDLTEAMKGAFKSGGFVVLTPHRYQIVRKHWRLCRQGRPWGGHAWRPWQNRDMMNNALRDVKAAIRRASIELTAPFNLHAFRKSYAQNLANAGTPPRTLAQLLGHSNTRVTMQFYQRATDANERAAGEAMNRLLAQEGQGAQRRKQG